MKKAIRILLMTALFTLAFASAAYAAKDEDKDYSIESCYIDTDGKNVYVEWDKPESSTSYKLDVYWTGTSGNERKVLGETIGYGTTHKDITDVVLTRGKGTYRAEVAAKKDSSCTAVSDEFEVEEDFLNSMYASHQGSYKAKYEWVKSGKDNWKLKRNGQTVRDGWALVSGKWYLFDEDGYMLKGWQERDEGWYYLEPVGNAAYPQGALWVSATVPGGYKVDANGLWIQ